MVDANEQNQQQKDVTAQQLTKDLVEIFKLRVTSLFKNTLLLFWPVLAIVVVYSASPFTKDLGSAVNNVLIPTIYAVLFLVFLFYSVPRIGLDRIEKRLWIRHYFSTREVMSEEESRKFIESNKARIVAFKRRIFNKTYLIPLIITFMPILIATVIVGDGVLRNSGSQLFVYAFFGLLIGVPLLIGGFLVYWLHTRTRLMFAWERFIDAVENDENLTDDQILHEAQELAKTLGLKGRARFMSYDFAASVVVGAPAVAVDQATRVMPQPVRQVANTYALLYSFNAYQLQNIAIAYCFYQESKAKSSNMTAA